MTTQSEAREMIPSTFDAPFEDPAEAFSSSDITTLPPPSSLDEMDAVFEVPVKVKAVLGGARVQVGELIQMRAGSVVELDRRVGEPVDVFVNDRFIARGELVLIDGSLGVTLTEIVKQDG
jgi:flagellar motor switch protein FliN/FliY